MTYATCAHHITTIVAPLGATQNFPDVDRAVYGQAVDTDTFMGKLYVAAPAVGAIGLASGALLYLAKRRAAGATVGAVGLGALGFWLAMRVMGEMGGSA